ncbi:MAG: RNA polymerase sigma factor [Polyangiaceae bacterium]|nr:RNA polymerase sigma factor [Polyangiaceae bacterium]
MLNPALSAGPAVSSAAPDDLDVIERVLGGETSLFELLMRRHNQRLFRTARAIMKDDVEAEDVVQEAYVRAFVSLRSFEGRAQLSTWLTRIVVHEAAARLRQRKQVAALAATLDPAVVEQAHPEREAATKELTALVERAIDQLPDDFRVVLMLRAVEGLSGSETAASLGIPEDTVKTRLFRARAQLHEAMERELAPALSNVHRFLAERCDRLVRGVMARLALLPTQ